MICCCHRDFLHHLVFEAVFCEWSPGGRMWAESIQWHGWLLFPLPSLQRVFTVPREHETPLGSTHLWASRNIDSWERSCFPFEPELVSTLEDNDLLRKVNDLETLLHPFLVMQLPSTGQSLMPRMNENQEQGNPLFFFLSVLPDSPVSWK